ncbi:glutathione peroxidase [Pseudidiomarina andamanensis]|uniref:Glutathione peroxidase n=1 Tax=Pseudidiomarina andamanensis TaxID=1940690 RepID=A0AA92ETE9_9GAMM|nr:glutathione peroxidase [Pseudidiomarina andamanensis]MDS0219002.1 glutathione peroxidase [Pseudidiomarina andamanensis]QGT96357.1 glutathione peroxidase [Pseudidiomarina andamanensis]
MKQPVQSKIGKRVALIAAAGVAGVTLFSAVAGGTQQEVATAQRAAQSFVATDKGCLATFDHSMRALHSKDNHNLCELTENRVVMVVNTASKCGYTGQFEGLEELYQTYKDEDFVILGFPSDSFRQEHNDEEETATVCFVNFGVTFPMMATTPVKGDEANAIFKALTQATEQAPGWNFHKYIVSADGKQVTSFPSKIEPMDKSITNVIDKYLSESAE